MPDEITSLSKMFADDAKVFRQIETSADTATLQNDLDHLTDWSKKWQMNFNVNKGKRFHIGPTNPHNKYTIAGIDLVESDQEGYGQKPIGKNPMVKSPTTSQQSGQKPHHYDPIIQLPLGVHLI